MGMKTEKSILHGELNKQHKEITIQPRVVHCSKELEKKIISNQNWKLIIQEISDRSKNGKSLNEYLHTHYSAKDEHSFNEKFLNATGLYHLHMNHFPMVGDRVERSDYWLFVLPTTTDIYLIDILPHSSCKPVYLYNILLDNWKNLFQKTILFPTPMSGDIPTEQDICAAIQGGINTPIVLKDGQSYSMFGRITTDGSSGIVLTQYDRILDWIKNKLKK